MSGAAVAGGIIGAAMDSMTSLFNTWQTNTTNYNIAEKNRQLQERTNAQNEQLMREAWARDDTARQRMVKDLEAAGLSKWLAAGASPMTSSPISLQAPQLNFKYQKADAIEHMYSNALANIQTAKQNEILDKQGEILSHNEEEAKAAADIKKHDAEVFANRPGVASTDPATLKYLTEILQFLRGKSKITGAGEQKTLPDGSSMGEGTFDLLKSLGVVDENGNVIDLPKKEKPGTSPLSFSDWCKQNQIDLSTKDNQMRASKLYKDYLKKFE